MDAQGLAPVTQDSAWTVPDEWNADMMGTGGAADGVYREPMDNSAPTSETASEQEWTPQPLGDGEDSYNSTVTYPNPDEQLCTPEPMGDGDDSGCNVMTGTTTAENEYMQTIADTLNTELDEQMRPSPVTPNPETDEAERIGGRRGSDLSR